MVSFGQGRCLAPDLRSGDVAASSRAALSQPLAEVGEGSPPRVAGGLLVFVRLVVEVDGAQHLADPVAYRRDRRKDQLLQENGYLVLRYLAEDLAKELDSVLDGILRSLSSRRTAMVPTHALNVVRGSRP